MFPMLSSRSSPSYTDVTGFGWDGKNRGEEEVARRIKGEWVITTRKWITFATKPVKGKVANNWEVYSTAKTSRVRYDGKRYCVVPTQAVRSIVVDQRQFEVLMIPCFVAYDWGTMVERCLLGCIGYNDVYDEAVLFSIRQDDPMLEGINFATVDIRDAWKQSDEVLNAPGYAPSALQDEMVESTEKEIEALKEKRDAVTAEDPIEGWGLTVKINLMEERLLGLTKGIDTLTTLLERKEAEAEPKKVKFGSFVEKEDPGEKERNKNMEALREFYAEQEEMMKRIKFDVIDGKKVVNLSHLAAKPVIEEEAKEVPYFEWTITKAEPKKE